MIQNAVNITNFRLEIPDQKATEAFQVLVQKANLCAMRIPAQDFALGPQGVGRQHLMGATTEFDPLIVRVVVDEELQSYLQIYRWMISLNDYAYYDPSMHGTSNNGNVEPPKAMTLHVLNNSKTEIIASFNYINAYPMEISELEFDYTQDGDPIMTVDVQFGFKYLEIEQNGQVIRPRREQ